MRRHRKLIAFTVLAITAVAASQTAFAADGDPQPTNPTGFGDLLPTPDLTNGDTRTLFENYGPMAYSLDVDSSWRDPLASVFNGYAQLVMMYIVAVIRGAISVGWWLFSLTDIKAVSDATSGVIGGASSSMMGWLLPSALAVGACAAYMQKRSSGSAMSQLLWVGAAGVMCVSFALSATTWVKGVDGARQLGAEAVMSASSASLDKTVQTPIAWPEPAFTGTPRDTLLRKSADATWRGFAVTPWCIAEFGSIEACQRYGKEILDRGTNTDARMDYINGPLKAAEGGSDEAATVRWTQGKNPFGRIGVLTLAAIAATLFAFLTVALAFTALMAFVGCLLLLVVGVFFTCLWVIPGRPRQWGINWFEALLGFVVQSILAMLVFATTLSLVTAVYGLAGVLGWLPVSGLAIVVLIAGFQLRRVLNSLTTMMRPGTGSLMVGRTTRRILTNAAGHMLGHRAAESARPVSVQARKERDDSLSAARSSASRSRFRQAPGFTAKSSGSTSIVLRTSSRDYATASSGPRINDSGPGVGVAPAGANGRRTATGDRFLPKPKQITAVASAPLAAAVAAGSGSGPGTAKSERDKVLNGAAQADRRRAAIRSSGTGQYRPPRYEMSDHSHSASLRDGPPKAPRQQHRRPRHRTVSAAPRSYREYSKVTKQGTTVHVPAGR
jgi:hypothetical protein